MKCWACCYNSVSPQNADNPFIINHQPVLFKLIGGLSTLKNIPIACTVQQFWSTPLYFYFQAKLSETDPYLKYYNTCLFYQGMSFTYSVDCKYCSSHCLHKAYSYETLYISCISCHVYLCITQLHNIHALRVKSCILYAYSSNWCCIKHHNDSDCIISCSLTVAYNKILNVSVFDPFQILNRSSEISSVTIYIRHQTSII